jgi:hypothetical protein
LTIPELVGDKYRGTLFARCFPGDIIRRKIPCQVNNPPLENGDIDSLGEPIKEK